MTEEDIIRGVEITRLSEERRTRVGYTKSLGWGDPHEMVVNICGPEHNDSSAFGCYSDGRMRHRTGNEVITNANAIVLALAKAFLTRDQVSWFMEDMKRRGLALTPFFTGQITWGGCITSTRSHIRKSQRSIVGIKARSYGEMTDPKMLEAEASREIEHEYLVELFNSFRGERGGCGTRLSQILQSERGRIDQKVAQIRIAVKRGDQARYYRALHAFNLTGVTDDEVDECAKEIRNTPTIIDHTYHSMQYTAESDDELEVIVRPPWMQ